MVNNFFVASYFCKIGIFSILRKCLPPSKDSSKKTSTIFLASFSLINLDGKEQILASLWCLARLAISVFQHKADLTLWCLLTVILIPLPLPQNTIPLLISLFSILVNTFQRKVQIHNTRNIYLPEAFVLVVLEQSGLSLLVLFFLKQINR